MTRTLAAIVLIGVAIFIAPLWLQYSLFVLSIIFVRHNILLLIPAMFADALYAPYTGILTGYTNTLIVAVLLLVYTVIMKKTRVGTLYDVAK